MPGRRCRWTSRWAWSTADRLGQPDYYGAQRLGDNRDANSLVALEAKTGRRVWAQQLVHHDLWDHELASQPALATVQTAQGPRAAVLQATKTGFCSPSTAAPARRYSRSVKCRCRPPMSRVNGLGRPSRCPSPPCAWPGMRRSRWCAGSGVEAP
jgi:hypothetical protein